MDRRSFVRGIGVGAVATVVVIVGGRWAIVRWAAPRITITNSGRLPLAAVRVEYAEDNAKQGIWTPGDLQPGESATFIVLCSDLYCSAVRFRPGRDRDNLSPEITCDTSSLATPFERIELFLDERGLVQVQGPRPRLPQP